MGRPAGKVPDGIVVINGAELVVKLLHGEVYEACHQPHTALGRADIFGVQVACGNRAIGEEIILFGFIVIRPILRSEERRVGKEARSWRSTSPYVYRRQINT